MPDKLHFSPVPSLPLATDKSHHKSDSTGFRNPWPSCQTRDVSSITILKTRFSSSRPPFVAVPEDRKELVQVRKPDFTPPTPGNDGRVTMKVTWIGHASFLVQCSPPANSSRRGINMLLDPVFSERTSPFTFFGPKRYTPTPCTLEELCENVLIDVVCISHNHYDHADATTLAYVFNRAHHEGREMVVCVGLSNARWVRPIIPAGGKVTIWEGDWWERSEVSLSESQTASAKALKLGSSTLSEDGTEDWQSTRTGTAPEATLREDASKVRITITPSQHGSARSPLDKDYDLWCSFAIELPPYSLSPTATSEPARQKTSQPVSASSKGPKLYFSGDTAYRSTSHPPIPTPSPSLEERHALHPNSSEPVYPSNPIFKQVGDYIGPFDLNLLPIGLTRPREFMSNVHADAVDAMEMHQDIGGAKAIGIHWGTVRGGLSGQYEDVRWPPQEWEAAAKIGRGGEGYKWRGNYRDGRSTRLGMEGAENKEEEDDTWEMGLMDVGESLVI